MDYRLALMTGIDIPIPECQLVIHQPSLKEISFIGEKTILFPLSDGLSGCATTATTV